MDESLRMISMARFVGESSQHPSDPSSRGGEVGEGVGGVGAGASNSLFSYTLIAFDPPQI